MLTRKKQRLLSNTWFSSGLFVFVFMITFIFLEDMSQTHASSPAVTSSLKAQETSLTVYGPSPSKKMQTIAPNPTTIPSGSAYRTDPNSLTNINEQFNGSSLNMGLWEAMTYPTGYRNDEEENYLPSQVRVSGGALQISATRDGSGAWHSGEVDSKWHYTYGDFSVRMALSTTGPGVWPAAWLMGTKGQWPTNGEIDIMENLNGSQTTYGTIHGGGANGEWQLQSAITPTNVLQYHTYEIKKHPGDISWWVDGIKQSEWKKADMPAGGVWPFESYSNFAILNLAIGGNWPGPTDETTSDTITMYVDSYIVANAS